MFASGFYLETYLHGLWATILQSYLKACPVNLRFSYLDATCRPIQLVTFHGWWVLQRWTESQVNGLCPLTRLEVGLGCGKNQFAPILL